MVIMKKYVWCFLILLFLFPPFGMDFGLLLGLFEVPLALIIVFVTNGIDIHRSMHDSNDKENLS